MTSSRSLLLVALLFGLAVLAGCAGSSEQPIVGATSNGTLSEAAAGSRLNYGIAVARQGDPIGIDFRGVLTQGRIKLQLLDSSGQIFEEWQFNEVGPFAMNTTLYPPPGNYRFGMAWDEPVQLAQYSLAWKPFPIEPPAVSALALVPGLGMILVALGFLTVVGVRKLGWGYMALGMLGWIVSVALKFAWAIPMNGPVYQALTNGLPPQLASPIFYLYVGALTGVFEVALVWLVLRFTRLGQVSWERALAFGLGFGAIEALLLGVSSLLSAMVALTLPASLPLEVLSQFAQTSNPLFGLAPVWERFFVILVHLFSNVLLFHSVVTRDPRWFLLAFLYKTGVDTVAAFAQFWGLNSLLRIWIIEGLIGLWGLAGWLGTRWLRARYQQPMPQTLAAHA